MEYDDLLMAAYELRERMIADKHRPRYHFLPPFGRWNDVNGMVYWKGRYHTGFLQKITNGPEERDFSSWQHVSSRDLVHWRYHKASLREPLEGKKGDYFNSGDVIEGAEIPTIITNMPRLGIVVYQCSDDDLDHWVPLSANPVIPIEAGWRADGTQPKPGAPFPESVIFDPSGWKEGGSYYALVGNKNYRPGYEGDSTSLFKSSDLKQWEYVGPFYKSERKWTDEVEDCACSDFFPFGGRYMLLMHTHRPYAKCQYYLGSLNNEQFFPESNGQLSWLGSMLAGPETLIDDRGRRIFLGWIREARDTGKTGWSGIMTLPWLFYPAEDGRLKIDPVEELQSLRFDEIKIQDIQLKAGESKAISELGSDCMETKMTLVPEDATEFGIKLLCSPDGQEETTVTYNRDEQTFFIDFTHASTDGTLKYPTERKIQEVPYALGNGDLYLDIFVDRSVVEIFVNSDIVLVQRVYPTRNDSREFSVFAIDGSVKAKNICKWEMDVSNPW